MTDKFLEAVAMAAVVEAMAVQGRSIPNANDMGLKGIIYRALCEVKPEPKLTPAINPPTDQPSKFQVDMEKLANEVNNDAGTQPSPQPGTTGGSEP